MKVKRLTGLLFFITIFTSGCSSSPLSSSPLPAQELSVYKDDCHVIGSDVYFPYNGREYIAQNQYSSYKAQLKSNSGFDILVLRMQDGSFTIPNK